jgi:CBS domain-containing protein
MNPTVLYHDPVPTGSGYGLGCASNLQVVACTYHNRNSANLVVYGSDGHTIFTSGALLNNTAWTSAPIVDASGGVIAADNTYLVRYAPDGRILWQAALPGGIPISPVLTANGFVLVATDGGPISAYSLSTGTLLGMLTVTDAVGRVYLTKNTPAINGNRAYISMAARSNSSYGRFVAIDVDPSNAAAPLSLKWAFPFGGPSGASPLFIGNMIYFDGAHLTSSGTAGPYMFGLQDLGNTCSLIWETLMPSAIKANAAQDPRGGLWVFGAGSSVLLRLSATSGAVLQSVDVNALLNRPFSVKPSSALSIVRGPNGETMMLAGASSASGSGNPSFAVALNLDSSKLVWAVQLANGDMATCQFPIVVNSQGAPIVVFPGVDSGAYFIGD